MRLEFSSEIWKTLSERRGGFIKRVKPLIAMVGCVMWMGGVARGDVSESRWTAIATVWGAGVRYAATKQVGVESRVLVGDGIAGSLRGTFFADKTYRKIRPLVGLELSVLAPVHGKGERGQSVAMFVGGEIHLTQQTAIQLDLGPALLRLQDPLTKKDAWEYENVFNISVNYTFGKRGHSARN